MVFTPTEYRVRSAPEAAEVAGISYRMLDHWHRAGWITATHTKRFGQSRVVRSYSDDAIVKLGALKHIAAVGKLDPGVWGPKLGRLSTENADLIVVTGDDRLIVVAEAELRGLVTSVGVRIAFDAAQFRSRLEPLQSQGDPTSAGVPTAARRRRTA
jgi:hypothetical protein